MGLFIVAALFFSFGLTLASVARLQLPRACLGKVALIMGSWGYEGNHL